MLLTCLINHKRVLLYRLPKDVDTRVKWCKWIGTENNCDYKTLLGQTLYLCGNHFRPEDKGIKKLKGKAVPTISTPPDCNVPTISPASKSSPAISRTLASKSVSKSIPAANYRRPSSSPASTSIAAIFRTPASSSVSKSGPGDLSTTTIHSASALSSCRPSTSAYDDNITPATTEATSRLVDFKLPASRPCVEESDLYHEFSTVIEIDMQV